MRKPLHLMRLAREGWDHRFWYARAGMNIQTLCLQKGWDWQKFIDVLAVTSPRMAVRRNLRVTMGYMTYGMLPDDVIRSTHAALSHYEETGEIRGPKTSAFAAALKGDTEAVVLDTWMALALGVEQKKFGTKRGYQSGARRVRFVSAVMGEPPARIQAAIWAGIVRRLGRAVPVIDPAEELDTFGSYLNFNKENAR